MTYRTLTLILFALAVVCLAVAAIPADACDYTERIILRQRTYAAPVEKIVVEKEVVEVKPVIVRKRVRVEEVQVEKIEKVEVEKVRVEKVVKRVRRH